MLWPAASGFLLAQVIDPLSAAALLEEIRKQSAKSDPSGVIYLFVLIIALMGVGGFFLLRYVLGHARDIHSESNRTQLEQSATANKTLLEITDKFENRCAKLTEMFSTECASLRESNARTMADARDMVHATRDIAQTSLTYKELLERYSKKEEELRLKAERDRPGT